MDLTNAVTIGKNAFMKETLTPFKVILGEDIEKISDNPFAMCKVEAFSKAETEKEKGKEVEVTVYTFELSDNALVIDGSLYCKNKTGLELITYAGINNEDVVIADDTVRITAYAFAGSDVVRVTMPFMTTAIGHKAFYDCNKLEMVAFGSYTVPNFEEEFDPKYYETFEHIPGTGDYGTYTDYNGNDVAITGTGMLPYYMWNATGSMYSNVFYGANFVDYVGYVENKLTMVRPVNGVGYDSYIVNQYFDLTIDGPAAPDDAAVDAILAIKAIPKRVTYDDKKLVETARQAYDKVATTLQQAMVNNYSDLVSAEQRVKALTPTKDTAQDVDGEVNKKGNADVVVAVILLLLILVVAVILVGNEFAGLLKTIFGKLAIKCKPVTDKIAKVCKPVTDKIAAVTKPAIDKIAKVCKPVFDKIACATKKAWNKVVNAAKTVWTKTVEFSKVVWTKVVSFVKAATPKVVNFAKIAAIKVADIAKLTASKIVDFAKKITTKKVKEEPVAETVEESTEEATEENVEEKKEDGEQDEIEN